MFSGRIARRSIALAAARGFLPTATVLAGLLAAEPAGRAQTLPLPRIDFNFSNPGARSLGFGGAFAGLADDATAAFANPAGLVQLVRPEVSLEGRSWNSTRGFIAGGRVAGEPTGIGLDVHDGILIDHHEQRVSGPSFASTVWPRGRFTLAVYGHRLAAVSTSGESQPLFDDDPFFVRGPASRDRTELTLNGLGLAAGWRAHERLSVGVAVVRMDLSLASRSDAFLPSCCDPSDLYDPVPFDEEHHFATSTLRVDDAATAASVGLLWSATDRLSAGLFYRRGPRFDGSFNLRFLPVVDEAEADDLIAAHMRVPDVWGGGVAFRSASGRVTVAGELDHVGYGELLRILEGAEVVFIGRDYQDSWEYHLGGEYALLDRRPIVAFRAGAWIDSHSNDLEHDRVTHWAAGVGVAGERIQVDLAADLSSLIDTVSLSLIYSF